MEPVDPQLIGHPEVDQQRTHKTTGQANQIKRSKLPVFQQIAPGNLKIAFEHVVWITLFTSKEVPKLLFIRNQLIIYCFWRKTV